MHPTEEPDFLQDRELWEGGQALWEEINSKDCSGWRIAGNIVGIGLNGVSLFLSGKGLFSETKALNKILKEDGIYDKLKLDNGGYVNLEFFFGSSKSGNNNGSNQMLGSSGTQVFSHTTWKNGKTERIDVENPAPGKRPGQIRYHDANNKYYYDTISNILYVKDMGELAPNSIQELLKNKDFMKEIKKALQILGE